MPKTTKIARYLGRKLLSLEHTGRLRAHEHTSYGSLLLILSMAVIPLLFIQHRAAADVGTTSGSGNNGIYAVVPAIVPTTAPAITNLGQGRVFTTNDLLRLTGTCPGNTLVKIFKNGVMTGATLCSNGVFALSIDLFLGGNSLIARAYNANDIPSPDSMPITVSMVPPGVTPNPAFNPNQPPAGQFYMTSDVYFRGAQVNENMSWPLTIAGGQPPYALSVNWGDGKSQLISVSNAGQLNLSHTYAKAANYNGSYTVMFKAVDQKGSEAVLQLFALVPGEKPKSTLTTTSTTQHLGGGGWQRFQLAWQLAALAAVVILSFWIGEKRHMYGLKHLAGRTA